MLKAWFINPLLVFLTAVAGLGICRAMGLHSHPREMFLAAGVCLAAAEAALVPLLLTRGASQGVVSQSALVSTAIHLLGSAAAGGAVSMLLKPGQPFMVWLLAFYWVTLAGVSWIAIRAVKTAPMETRPQ